MEITTLKNTTRKHYIYKVTNRGTGQYYIGSQCRGKTIGVNYFTSSKNKEFKSDFKNYREEKYKIEVIKEFEDPEECVRVENYIIRNHMRLKDGLCLNRAYHCNGEKIFSTVGTHPSEETRKRISETRKGLPHPHKGIHHSEETRKKMSEAKKGIPCSEETRQKMSMAHKGIYRSEETRKKLSEVHKIKISVEGTIFNSLTEASKYYNVTPSTIGRWAENKKHNAVYIEK